MKLFKRTITLLLFLILISGIVTYFLVFHDNGKTKISDFESKKILSLLDEHNIEINPEVLPKSHPDLPVISLKNSVHEQLIFAKQVLGKKFSVISSGSYTNDNLVLNLEGNEFSIDFPKEALLKNEFILSNPENHGNLIRKGISKLGFDKNEVEIVVNNNDSYATVFKTVEGYPVFDCSFRVSFDNGISKVSGIWFEPLESKYYKKHKSLITVISKVCENSDFNRKEITEISAGFKIGEISGYKKEVIATPVWRITFDNKLTYDYEM